MERASHADDELAPPLRIVDKSPRFAMLWEAVLFDHELTSNAKVIYGVLQRMAHEEHGVFAPSKNDIGSRAGIKDRGTVLACLKALKERGYIDIETRGHWETDVITLVDPNEFTAGKTSTLRKKPAGTPCGKNQHLLREKPAPPAGKTSTLTDTKRTRERMTPHDAANQAPVASPNVTPYALWETFCDAAEQDITTATTREKGYSLKVAQRLIADGVGVAEVRAYVAFRRSQAWRNDALTMASVEKHIGAWRMAGKPASESKPPARPAYTSQADWNAAGQRNPDGTLKPIA